MARVLLISMPYASLERPALGLGLLQAELRAAGHACDTRYLAFAFADCIGVEDYLWVSRDLPYTAFAGDWLFTEALYGARPDADRAYVEEVLRARWRLGDDAIARLRRLRSWCEPFLAHCLRAVAWDDYDVVGLTSTFEQNIASLALARRIKAAQPDLAIAFGGANWEGEMGAELHRRFPFVDLVCSGEADRSFPAAVTALSRGGALADVPGIVFRDGGATRVTPPGPLLRDLDALPFPDFDAFFADRDASPAACALPVTMLAETGRGCWWGARSHCTFCGLNGGSLAFRSKAPERALAELRHLRDRHGTSLFSMVDNILDMGYFRTLLPQLAEEDPPLSLFYEIKANLTSQQVALLAAAGVRLVQPGIESLSDHVLQLMRKGTTALRNVALLKWCREQGVRPEWNLLYGFPGETAQDYAEMLALIERISFLDPPSAEGPVRLDRFSPYHADPAAAGMVRVRPMAPYRHLYPFPDPALRRIAYYFDYDHADGRDPRAHAEPVLEAIRRWRALPDRGGLWLLDDGAGGATIVDRRAGRAPRALALDGWRAAAYRACDRVRSLRGLAREPALAGVGAQAIAAFTAHCTQEGLMLRQGEDVLALAVTTPARAWAPAVRPHAEAAA